MPIPFLSRRLLLTGLALPSLRDALLTVHRPPVDADLAALVAMMPGEGPESA